MNLNITFRHMDPSDAVKRHVTAKLQKLERFLRQPMTARVTLSHDKLEHTVEVRLSSGGQHHEAKECSEDLYASLDLVIDKLGRQIQGTKGARQAKERRSGSGLRRQKTFVAGEAAVAPHSEGSKKGVEGAYAAPEVLAANAGRSTR